MIYLQISHDLSVYRYQVYHDLSNLQIDHDLQQILTYRYDIFCRICIVQIQPRKHALDHADCMGPTLQHEL